MTVEVRHGQVMMPPRPPPGVVDAVQRSPSVLRNSPPDGGPPLSTSQLPLGTCQNPVIGFRSPVTMSVTPRSAHVLPSVVCTAFQDANDESSQRASVFRAGFCPTNGADTMKPFTDVPGRPEVNIGAHGPAPSPDPA